MELHLRLTLRDGLSTFGPSATWNDLNGLTSVNENPMEAMEKDGKSQSCDVLLIGWNRLDDFWTQVRVMLWKNGLRLKKVGRIAGSGVTPQKGIF